MVLALVTLCRMLRTRGKAPEIAYKVHHMAKATIVMTVGLFFNMTLWFLTSEFSVEGFELFYPIGWLISCIGIALLG